MWNWMGSYGMGGGMFGMAVFWIVLVVALAWIARVAWGRGASREGGPSRPPETPLDILQRRYARGEMDRAEYEEKRKDLGGS